MKFIAIVMMVLTMVGAPRYVEATTFMDLNPILYSQRDNLVDWSVGDKAEYTIETGFIPGTMVKEVVKDEGDAIWVNTSMDLLIMKEKVEMLIRKVDGAVLRVIRNGKEESLPEDDSIDVISQDYQKVETPAGIIPCIHIVFNTKDIQNGQLWISEKPLVMDGMVQTKVPGQGMEITIKLKSFKKK